MNSTIRTASLLTAALFLGACSGKDAQTEGEVTTKTAGGEASTSISGDSADKRGQALVRVVNAVPNVKGLSVRADEMHALPPVDYKNVTPYQAIDRNWVTFQIAGAPGGTYEPLETNREMLTEGHRYTIVIMKDDDGEGYDTRILRDEISDDATSAQLRVIHAAQGIDEIDVVAKGGDRLFEGVNFSSEAGFKGLTPWAGALEFRSEKGNRLLLTMPDVDLRAGKSYTIVLSRGTNGKLEAFWFEDAQTS
ncbi:MAG: DUF4397 domain-containing protein [Gemmatimonadaceae bacterium]